MDALRALSARLMRGKAGQGGSVEGRSSCGSPLMVAERAPLLVNDRTRWRRHGGLVRSGIAPVGSAWRGSKGLEGLEDLEDLEDGTVNDCKSALRLPAPGGRRRCQCIG